MQELLDLTFRAVTPSVRWTSYRARQVQRFVQAGVAEGSHNEINGRVSVGWCGMRTIGLLLIVWGMALLLPSTSVSQSVVGTKGSRAVEGTVVLSGEERPVRDARVDLYMGAAGTPLTAVADDEGKFGFAEVAPGTYRVIVSAAGCETLYETSKLPGGVPLVYRLRRAGHMPNPRNNSVVSIEELKTPEKVEKAFEKGTRYLLKGEVEASLPYFQKAIEQAPSYFRSYHNLGLAHYQLGQFDAAEQDFQEAIDLSNGGFAPSLFALSMVFYQRADFRQAEMVLQRGLELAPGSGVGKYCLALVQYSLGRTTDAERSALDALRVDPAETDAYVLLGHIHAREHNPYAVMADAEAYLKLDPNGSLQGDARELLMKAREDASRVSAALR